jgi:penicillin-binding protein 2
MEDVTLVGTAKYIPKIPGINICAKTGTAENFHGGEKQKDHSIFACFAPRENPQIAIAVIVENGGFGSTWAGPMAYLMIEKYLTDSLRADRKVEVDRIAGTNLLPAWLEKDQYKEDSSRAYFYFNLTKDSNYIRKYIKKFSRQQPVKKDSSLPVQRIVYHRKPDLIEPEKTLLWKRKNTSI